MLTAWLIQISIHLWRQSNYSSSCLYINIHQIWLGSSSTSMCMNTNVLPLQKTLAKVKYLCKIFAKPKAFTKCPWSDYKSDIFQKSHLSSCLWKLSICCWKCVRWLKLGNSCKEWHPAGKSKIGLISYSSVVTDKYSTVILYVQGFNPTVFLENVFVFTAVSYWHKVQVEYLS